MISYETFRQSCLDLSALGLQDSPSVRQGTQILKDAKVLAWLLNSPAHFCQLPEQGETVFAVDPNGLPSEQILPVAQDIGVFIGLLICCKNAALIARAYQWSSFRLQKMVDDVNPGMKTRSVLRALENIYHPPVIHNPGALMSRLRQEFIGNAKDSDWHVGFDTDFSQTCSKEKCGKELPVNRSLSNQNMTWTVPSVYLCDDGIVVDVFKEVSTDRLKKFSNDWGDRSKNSLSVAEKLQCHLDDPLTASVAGILTVNDKLLHCKGSFSAIWNPFNDNDAQVRRILKHYRLDPDRAYLFRRYCFLRKGRQPQIRTMQLTLEAMPVMVPDECFTVHNNGMRFRFTHPATGLQHTFTAVSLTQEALNPNFLTNHPCFYSRLTYTLEPSISPENFRITDRDPSDYWDGYQDEPAAVVFAGRKPDSGRYALSSLHYEPKEQIQWQMIFRRKLHKDILLELFP